MTWLLKPRNNVDVWNINYWETGNYSIFSWYFLTKIKKLKNSGFVCLFVFLHVSHYDTLPSPAWFRHGVSQLSLAKIVIAEYCALLPMLTNTNKI